MGESRLEQGMTHAARRLRPNRISRLAGATALLVTMLVSGGSAGAEPGDVKVMTRNVYLGADLTGATQAPDLPTLFAEAGEILRDVDATNFPARSRPLAREILDAKPDLVGLQEVALWRVDTTPDFDGEFNANEVRYDFLDLLMDRLGDEYRIAKIQKEFDFESPADEDDNGSAEIEGRLTMRDVILARRGHGVEFTRARGAHFENLLELDISGFPVTVQRGWTSVNANVRGERFRFVNTHLEAFTTRHRRKQARELVAPGGPAQAENPVVLVGDLNSDDDTVFGRDRLAYELLLDFGFEERSDASASCCASNELLDDPSAVGDFDHQVDHVMTDTPGIELVDSFDTGTTPFRDAPPPIWASDHGGVFSKLRFR